MPQRVDPFLPVSSSPSARFRPHVEYKKVEQAAQSRPLSPTRKVGTIDGFLHGSQPRIHHPSRSVIQPPYNLADRPHPHVPPTHRPPIRQTHQITHRKPNTTTPVKRNIFRKVQVLLILLAVIGVNVFLQSLIIGELFVVAYAVFAFVRHIRSRTTFLLALLSLLCILLLLILRSNNLLASNFAVYTFLLLAIGTISLGREVRTASS